jgi:AraC-like DNA-binding protein
VVKTIKTYSMLERLEYADFGIHYVRGESGLDNAHRHEYFQIQLHVGGNATHQVGATTLKLGPGSMCFVLPYRVHRAGRFPGSRFYVINFEQRFLRSLPDVHPLDLEDVPLERAPELAPFLFQEHLEFSLAGDDLVVAQNLCRSMVQENSNRRYCSLEIIHAQLILLLTMVCRRYEGRLLALAGAQVQLRARRDALSRVVRHMRQSIGSRITLTEAAAAAHLSPNYLTHLLKKETGKTFIDLVTSTRMERARQLLAETNLRIREIAGQVGFGDEAYFTRRFKQYFKTTPRTYRNSSSTIRGDRTRSMREKS